MGLYIEKSEICPGNKSDHSLIKLKLKTASNRRGQGFWKLNCSFLKDDKYIKKITTTIQETVENNPNTEPPLLWDTVKCRIRGETVAYASKIKKNRMKKIKSLQDKIKELQEDIINNATEIENLQAQLINEVEDRTQNAIFRAQVRYQDEGEKPTKYFLNLERRNFNRKVIDKLKINDNIITKPEHILSEQVKFYKNIYTSKLDTDNEICIESSNSFHT